jgi:SAM-dependent methyltransferase
MNSENSQVFGDIYAGVYDSLYQDKDYEAECDLLEAVFQRFGQAPVHHVLDLGCGTGNHSIRLAQRGYAITGVDRSPDMLASARQKAKDSQPEAGMEVEFLEGDLRSFRSSQVFDAVLMMFAVLGYQVENADVLAALHTARQGLKLGGLLVLDVWYGPAVLVMRPTDRVKVIPIIDGTILRVASGRLDTRHQTCTVRYHLWRLEGNVLTDETSEEHTMRYFFARELEFFFQQAGLTLETLSAFPDLDRQPDETTWNVLAVGRAI